jgi:uncharacterized membrane protein YkvA (DUF1232 family)
MRGHAESYDEASFWRKLRRLVGRASRELVERALILYYCLKDPDTPSWARAVILAALGYFVLPADLVPDLVPFTGLADDFGVLVSALASVAGHVKPEHRQAAGALVSRWTGDGRRASGAG